MGPSSRAALVIASEISTQMITDLRSDLDTYRNRLDELGRFL